MALQSQTTPKSTKEIETIIDQIMLVPHVQTQGEIDMAQIRELFFDHYPDYRPTYADCQLLMVSVYAISVRGSLANGQRICLKQVRDRLVRKGFIK